MDTYGRGRRAEAGRRYWVLLVVAVATGCQSQPANVDTSISAYRDRMLAEHEQEPAVETPLRVRGDRTARPAPGQTGLAERASLMSQPATTSQPSPEEVLRELPDPIEAPQTFAQRLEKLRAEQADRQDQRVVRNYERVVQKANEYLAKLALKEQVRLSLAECIQRALEHNYTVRYQAHNPAISQTQIVEAEAAFDVEFFLDSSWANRDQATVSAFVPGTSDTRSIQGGFRKLLPTGMAASVYASQQRSKNNLPSQYQTLNPAYNSSFVAELRQPLLRGFGLDVNRAPISIAKIQHGISMEDFLEKVRDTVLAVEQTYWGLMRARREVAIQAEAVAQNWVTWQNMQDRLDHDATQVEVANSEARFRSTYVGYLSALKAVRDLEDRLKNLLNDPSLKLSEELEIIPTETPFAGPMALDHFAEVRTALDNRTEIHKAKKQIELARINTMTSKNAILPQLDVSFQYEVQGIGNTSDNSFDNLTTNRFISYTLAASFSYNFGERKARAAHRRARLQESQAVVLLNQVSDQVVAEVNEGIRTLKLRYEQIPPALSSVQAAERNLRALQARTQRIDPSYLQTELSAVQQLADTRSALLAVLTDYNSGIVELERAKGTLLDYNNVTVCDARSGR